MTAAPAPGALAVPQGAQSELPQGAQSERPYAKGRRVSVSSRVMLAVGSAAIVSAYLLALGSPLRLFFGDPVTYLSLADGLRIGPHQGYPPGYPMLLRLAEHVGLGSAPGFVALNLAMLAIGLGSVYLLCRRRIDLTPARAVLVCLAVLLTHTISELAPVLMSDTAYFGVAMMCVLVLSMAESRSGRSRVALLVLACALAGVGISVRFAGLALVPALAYVAARPYLVKLWRVLRGRPVAIAVCAAISVIVLVGAAVVVIRASPYGAHVAHTWRTGGGPGAFLGRLEVNARAKLSSLGEVALQTNCCTRVATAVGVHKLGLVASGFAIAGLALAAVAAYGWRTRRRVGAIEVFVLSTAAVILVYTGGSARFWIAALPFLIAYGLLGLERLARSRLAKVGVVIYLVVFVLAGGAWLIDSVRISTAGRDFPRVAAGFLDPPLAASYRVAFGQAQPGDELKAMPLAVKLLRRYEPLARDPAR